MSGIITYSFHEPFIDRLADYIEENYLRKGKDLSRLAVVFGGKRPALFLNRELSRRARAAFFSTRFFTVDEFIRYTLQKKEVFSTGQDLDNCYLLYTLAQRETPEILKGREDFARFLPWSREILAFIDQLDLEGIEDERLLKIQANATIGYDVPEDINRLLKSIVVLRKGYHRHMEKNKTYARGFQYLRAAQTVDEIQFDEFDSILFCNFFYLNRCEGKVVRSLYDRKQATLIFQGDERKWPVLERLSKEFACPIRETVLPARPPFDLKLYSAFDGHSQVGCVREVLTRIDKKDLDKTVIVLPNAEHLVPLLSEVAEAVQEFNVSMGYPLKRSSLYSLCAFVFRAQGSRKQRRYYARDYLKALRHPFVKNLELSEHVPRAVTRTLIHKIEEILTGKHSTAVSGSLFIALKDIEDLDDLYLLVQEAAAVGGHKVTRKRVRDVLVQIHHVVFRAWEKIRDLKTFAQVLEHFLDTFTGRSFLKDYPLNLNIAAAMYAVKDEFQNAHFAEEAFDQESIFKIFDGKVAREMVAFRGSPLKGLQILGLFETRSLNFKNVIVLDVNEGLLPKLSVYEPLIPREVMIGLSLSRLELEEEIQRYQFMRLIASAQNVHLIYQESKDKEKSRFIEELAWEEQKEHKKLEAAAPARAGFRVKVAPQKVSIRKTPEVIAHLRRMRYSASSVNTYLRNPVEFYYTYVLGLRPEDDLLDEPEARHVGTFIHELLEESFKSFLGKKPQINAAFRSRFEKMFEDKFAATFGRTMKSDAFMLKAVMAERLKRFLDNEQESEDRRVEEILFLENRFEDTIPLSCGDIRFSYVVDRIDRMADGTHMIIDYKTGALDQMPKALDRIEAMELSRENIFENVRSFQIPLYFYYLGREFKGKPVNAALYSLRTFKLDRFIDERMRYPVEEINKVFLRVLDFTLSEILDPGVDFESDEHIVIHPGGRR